MRVNIKNSKILELRSALSLLDPQRGPSPFKFSAKVRYALALNLQEVQRLVEPLEALRHKLVAEHGITVEEVDGGRQKLSGDRLSDYVSAVSSLMSEESEVNVRKIKVDDLNLDVNQVALPLLCILSACVVEGDLTTNVS